MNIDRSAILPGSRVLCAVSGGADSMCLLHWLHSQQDLELFAAHFEHGIRGEESLRDAAFVETFCRQRGILCVTEHGDVPALAREKGLGLEEAARELRYAFLERTAGDLQCDWILTAHNADDNAETVLLNLCRGAGIAGLSGIPPERGWILRPLLGCTREEIEAYLRDNGVPHVEDSSNDSPAFSRNRIRQQVMPVLRTLNPRVSEAVLRSSRLLRQDGDCLDQLAEDYLQSQKDGDSLVLSELLRLHPALRSRVLRLFCGENLEQAHVDAALDFCAGQGLAFLDLPGLLLRREQGRLWRDREERVFLPRRELHPGERVDLPEAGLSLEIRETVCGGEIHDLFKTYLFKTDRICGTLICTGRLPGDRYHPQGRGCGKSLHDLFRDSGLTQRQRDLLPVLRDDAGVLAVLGYPADERVRPEPGDPCVEIHFTKL